MSALSVAVILGVIASPSHGTTIQFDYSLDSGGFFAAGSQARDSLVAAGQSVESLLLDELEAIEPSGGNRWSATFTHPSTGTATSVAGLHVAADTLVIFVGARDLAGATIGSAGPGGFSARGSSSWMATVESRGQGTTSGATAADFGPWGGSLAMDSLVTWNTDPNQMPQSGENDLYSVILHELGHILGVGTADSWFRLVDSASHLFTGPSSGGEYGAAVPLTTNDTHWQNGVSSTIMGTSIAQETAFDPTIATGTRKMLTTLDVTSLEDIGWQVVPEPSGLWMLILALPWLWWRRPSFVENRALSGDSSLS